MKNMVFVLLAGLWSAHALATQPAAPAAVEPAPSAVTLAVAGKVTRAQITTAVREREPVDTLISLSNDVTQVFYFTELKGFAGSKITHRWEYKGAVVAEKSFDVGSERWRVWTRKQLDPAWTGEWKVSVVDASGATVSVQTFSYTQTAATPAVPVAPAQPAAY